MEVAQWVELEEDHHDVQHGVSAPKLVILVPPYIAEAGRYDDRHKPRQGIQGNHERSHLLDVCQLGHANVERSKARPISRKARQKPTLHLQGLLRDEWEPSLSQPRLHHQHECRRRVPLRLRNDESHQQRSRVEGIDYHASSGYIAEHGLLPGTSCFGREEDKAGEHKEPRHPSEAPTEEVYVGNGLPRVKVAQDDVQRGHAARQAQGEALVVRVGAAADSGALANPFSRRFPVLVCSLAERVARNCARVIPRVVCADSVQIYIDILALAGNNGAGIFAGRATVDERLREILLRILLLDTSGI
mmetsp:Transcript_182936/g.579645  ORF Transcript_182936/g.579645 Transcript_182936/m.579645 type:complete len:303 (+) Transcript_182936:2869-3777(+)